MKGNGERGKEGMRNGGKGKKKRKKGGQEGKNLKKTIMETGENTNTFTI